MNRMPHRKKAPEGACDILVHGADDGARTRDLRLGKAPLYQLSYIRIMLKRTIVCGAAPQLLYYVPPFLGKGWTGQLSYIRISPKDINERREMLRFALRIIKPWALPTPSGMAKCSSSKGLFSAILS